MIFYLKHSLNINSNILWPEWVSDRPQTDQMIRFGEPVCTIYAEGKQSDEVTQMLNSRWKFLDEFLSGFYEKR
jgi:predicted ATP-grasp superfamily ATP-dependent carboligase